MSAFVDSNQHGLHGWNVIIHQHMVCYITICRYFVCL